MTLEEFELLKRSEIRQFLEKNINQDSAKIALSKKGNDRHPALVYSQLKILQKSKKKLPSFYKKFCIIPPRAYEQSSSERAASHKKYNGKRCLDLCCGLGVDSFYLAKKFEEVIALEADLTLAAVTAYNMELLGQPKVKVQELPAETFLKTYNGPPFDLIYADPDRRDAKGKRQIRLEDCMPDILGLLSLIQQHTHRLVLKMSPLFDIQEAFRLFPNSLSRLTILSIDNECKEVLIEGDFATPSPIPQIIVICDRQGTALQFEFSPNSSPEIVSPPRFSSNYLCEPDVGFYKARVVPQLLADYFPQLKGSLTHPQGVFLSETLPEAFPGRAFQIADQLPYKPKQLKRLFGKQRMHVVKRNFPFSVAEIRRQTGIKEGGDRFLYCTQMKDEKVAFLLDTREK